MIGENMQAPAQFTGNVHRNPPPLSPPLPAAALGGSLYDR